MRQALGRRATRGKGRGLIRSKSPSIYHFPNKPILLCDGLNYESYFDNSTFTYPHRLRRPTTTACRWCWWTTMWRRLRRRRRGRRRRGGWRRSGRPGSGRRGDGYPSSLGSELISYELADSWEEGDQRQVARLVGLKAILRRRRQWVRRADLVHRGRYRAQAHRRS